MWCCSTHSSSALLLFPPPPFSSFCLSVSRHGGDSKSPRRKPICLGESARQNGERIPDMDLPRKLIQTKPHLFSPPCLTSPPPPPLKSSTLSVWPFSSSGFVSARHGGGFDTQKYLLVVVDPFLKYLHTPPPAPTALSPEQKITLLALNSLLPPAPFWVSQIRRPRGQTPDIKVSIEEPSVQCQLMWDTTN